MVDTGAETMTGGRLKRVARYLDPDESFCMTYGDGVADIDITGWSISIAATAGWPRSPRSRRPAATAR